MGRRHRTQRLKPSLNVYKESRSISELEKELLSCDSLLKEQRALRKNRVRQTNPETSTVPEKGQVKGGWRYEAKLLRAAARRLEAQQTQQSEQE
jgi:hypothetical protein